MDWLKLFLLIFFAVKSFLHFTLEWSFTILPIWFVGMTFIPADFACKDAKTSKTRLVLAGLFDHLLWLLWVLV